MRPQPADPKTKLLYKGKAHPASYRVTLSTLEDPGKAGNRWGARDPCHGGDRLWCI